MQVDKVKDLWKNLESNVENIEGKKWIWKKKKLKKKKNFFKIITLCFWVSKTNQKWQRNKTYDWKGDYCDKGEKVKELIEWLINLKEKRKEGKTHFLMGNHDYGFCNYIGLFEKPENFHFKETWSFYDKYNWDGDYDDIDIHRVGKKKIIK